MGVQTPTLCLVLFLRGVAQALHIMDGEEFPANINKTMDVGDTILMMNKGSPDYLIEGDVMIPRKRTAMKCHSESFSCLWPMSNNGKVEVPFLISDQYASDEVASILKALTDFHSVTCIRFIPRETQQMYIQFESRVGCFSAVGRIGERQVISLQRNGCVKHGVIQHEVMHSLGFYHEHARSDRDDHIQIHWENIILGEISNFQKMDTNNLGKPYDYQSVMHYGRTAFSTNMGDTMTPIPDASIPIGQRVGMSKIDIEMINKLYKCSSTP